MAKSLYICYFGVREPLVQTQVLPYLRELVKGGYEMTLLTFEPRELEAKESDAIRSELAKEGIGWHRLRYHKWPSVPATAFDIMSGARFIRNLVQKDKIDILHARSHVPMLIAALARKSSSISPKLLFDIRGFFPEEYVDAGVWPENGWLYRNAKRVEAWLMKEADGFVVLTQKARQVLFPESRESGRDSSRRPVQVIPCCVDFAKRFSGDRPKARAAIKKELNIDGRFVMTHVGALGGLYLTEQIADLLATARTLDPRTFAMFLTQSDPKIVLSLLAERGFSEADYFIARVQPEHVADYLYASDVGISFVKSSYSTLSRSPTKIPEYLACGIPIISNSGVGDVDELISGHKVGSLVQEFTDEGYVKALKEIRELGDVSSRCRKLAEADFDLGTVGGERYRRIYQQLCP